MRKVGDEELALELLSFFNNPLDNRGILKRAAVSLKKAGFGANPPSSLFRYRSIHIGDEGKDPLEWIFREIEFGEIYMCKTSDFDDPYDFLLSVDNLLKALGIKIDPDADCSILVTISDIMHSLVQYMDEHRGEELDIVNLENALKSKQDEITLDDSDEEPDSVSNTEILGEIFSTLVSDTRTITSVCCFTSKNDSLTMWDRYASGHTGICIEYDSAILTKKNGKLFKVKYSKKAFNGYHKRMDFLETIMVGVVGSILTKNSEYRYEKEWRGFTSFTNKNYFDGSDAIKCVYLGARIDETCALQISNLCKKLNIPVKRMVVCNNRYSLKIIDEPQREFL